jgi:hypothetical protein
MYDCLSYINSSYMMDPGSMTVSVIEANAECLTKTSQAKIQNYSKLSRLNGRRYKLSSRLLNFRSFNIRQPVLLIFQINLYAWSLTICWLAVLMSKRLSFIFNCDNMKLAAGFEGFTVTMTFAERLTLSFRSHRTTCKVE